MEVDVEKLWDFENYGVVAQMDTDFRILDQKVYWDTHVCLSVR